MKDLKETEERVIIIRTEPRTGPRPGSPRSTQARTELATLAPPTLPRPSFNPPANPDSSLTRHVTPRNATSPAGCARRQHHVTSRHVNAMVFRNGNDAFAPGEARLRQLFVRLLWTPAEGRRTTPLSRCPSRPYPYKLTKRRRCFARRFSMLLK